MSRPHRDERGFTLLEAMIAMAIVALVVTVVLSIRTHAVIDAAEARNWRVAREMAQEILSELQAGARQEPPEWNMDPAPIPKMKDVKGWSYQIVIGEERIASRESDLQAGASNGGAEDAKDQERRRWQQERDDLRKAKASGMSFYDYKEKAQLKEDERQQKAEEPPSEDQIEEVAVFVFFPNLRPEQTETGFFVLKARMSTMAIEGLTPDEAETRAKASGKSGATPEAGSGAGGTGTAR
ncbi:MAG: type II secretion system protein [Planctomycetes bacterium]|nr:type II secretion system protein [Planctomycetota bacterium]